MVCVLAYAGKEGQVNNCIPILTATWLGNVFILEREKRKRLKEKDNDKPAT
jgi:hypothetical protein